MKRLLAFTFALILLISGCSSGTVVSKKKPEKGLNSSFEIDEVNFRFNYDYGYCRSLSGNVAVVLFYMDDFESQWSSEEISSFTADEVVPALQFLESQAKRYGVELSFDKPVIYRDFYYNGEVIPDINLDNAVSIDVLKQAGDNMGFSDDEAFFEFLRSDTERDEVVCLALFNKNGTAYAVNVARDYDSKVPEHCIAFSQRYYSEGDDPDGSLASVVAHEILHLFGAEDFYNRPKRQECAYEHYPDDIMLEQRYDITTQEVDKATAYYVGWTDTVPDIVKTENWQVLE